MSLYNNPESLVSIVVITYNSASTVLETLESAKAQSHQKLELLISDDCSTDDTVATCERWVQENTSRFVNCKIITSPLNTGMPSNCNRAVKVASGEWIKLIAGDDILNVNCIEDFLHFAARSDFKLMFSNMTNFKDGVDMDYVLPAEVKHFFKLSLTKKYKEFIRHAYFLNSPTIFVHLPTLRNLGYFDEAFKYLEDLPIILKFLKHKEDIGFLPACTVRRRVHEKSISSMSTSVNPFREEFRSNLYESYRQLRRPYLSWFNIVDVYAIINTDMTFIKNKRPTLVVRFLFGSLIVASKIKRLFKPL